MAFQAKVYPEHTDIETEIEIYLLRQHLFTITEMTLSD